MENGGKITLPEEVVDRYQLEEDTAVRVIETRNGILLVPLSDAPMNDALRAELEEWQALGLESFETFPFEEVEK
jgi:bifunctional DNA-binding transcriptional regulator/antitoxin component of YhaV-PrlF toxin-antitoxin module